MKKVYGNAGGLKANQIRRLEKLYRRRVPPELLITLELARDMSLLAHEIRRQVGLLVNRQGRIVSVVVGDAKKIVIPSNPQYRAAPGRLNGLRCIHTHLGDEPLTQDDLADLALLRLDIMAAIRQSPAGLPHSVHMAHVLPGASERLPCRVLPPLAPSALDIDCLALIQAIEHELERLVSGRTAGQSQDRALLVSVSSAPRRQTAESMAELRQLACSGGIDVVGSVSQHREKVDHRFLMGSGKLQDLAIRALQEGATIIIFDQELNPSQIRSITDLTDLKVIDRTQLILDIFAQRAQSREGKLQVELAQLKYLLPRLVGKGTALSRLAGGIGGRGPGETKLEIDRRRVRSRIAQLERGLDEVRRHRQLRRTKRDRKHIPVISIIGYTNAGKSSLLNTLTKSDVMTESRLFATLDPSSRRLRFPRDVDAIITDTVGFIRDLPRDLMVAFRATLEELESADLFLHVIDVSNPRFEDQIQAVEAIIMDLQLDGTACLKVLNKSDLVDPELLPHVCRRHNAVAICALEPATLPPLITRLQSLVEKLRIPGEGPTPPVEDCSTGQCRNCASPQGVEIDKPGKTDIW